MDRRIDPQTLDARRQPERALRKAEDLHLEHRVEERHPVVVPLELSLVTCQHRRQVSTQASSVNTGVKCQHRRQVSTHASSVNTGVKCQHRRQVSKNKISVYKIFFFLPLCKLETCTYISLAAIYGLMAIHKNLVAG